MKTDVPAMSTYQWSCTDPTHTFHVHNPATGKIITTVQGGNADSTKKAIDAAQKAFASWRWLPLTTRARYLIQCAAALEQHAQELANLLCLENGKPAQDAYSFDVQFLIKIFRYFGSLIDKLPTQFHERGAVNVAIVREPHGVCAGILPFNWPPIHAGGKSAPALAAGNTIILKPGEQAPLTVMRIVQILQSVLPEGVVQAIPGVGSEVPQTLVDSPHVKMVSLTGSTPSGMIVAKAAAASLKHLALELGGKNAFIVFNDCDIDRATRDALEGGFFNKGEACTASSRLLIHQDIYDEFVARLSKAITKLKVGDGMEEGVHIGPCVSLAQQQRVLGYIKTGEEEGASIAAQAARPTAEHLKDGYFVPPTLFSGVTPSMKIFQDEIFGPVVTATKFKNEDDAVAMANSSRYGLVGAVYTKDGERGMRVSRRLEVGMVFLNNYKRNVLGLPFGGVKDSGYGREHCIDTLDEWTSPKLIQMPSGLGDLDEMSWRGVHETFQD